MIGSESWEMDDVSNRPQAIRRLIEAGLKAKRRK
jgi:hypothetical protein